MAIERGLAWVVQHLEYLRPSDLFNPEHHKETAELAILYTYFHSWVPDKCSASLALIHSFILETVSDPVVSEWVRKLPAHYSPYALTYLYLRAAGTRIAAYEEALAALHASGYPDALESTPYRELELQHALWKAGLAPTSPGCDGIYRSTTLARGRNPVYFSVAEVYSITHTLFYLADVAGPLTVMPHGERSRAGDVVEALAIHFRRKKDWDVSGELLLNLIALDRVDTPLFHACMNALLDAWGAAGALPGPGVAPAPDAPVKEVVNHCYHTTLVGLLLCGAWLFRAASSETESAHA